MWYFIFMGSPAIAVSCFLIFLVRYFMAPKGSEERGRRKYALVTSGIIAGVLVGVLVAIIILFMLAIANM